MLGAMENKQLSVVSVELMPVRGFVLGGQIEYKSVVGVELMPVRGCMMKKCLA